jgi:hypothetical protein
MPIKDLFYCYDKDSCYQYIVKARDIIGKVITQVHETVLERILKSLIEEKAIVRLLRTIEKNNSNDMAYADHLKQKQLKKTRTPCSCISDLSLN